MKKIISSVLLFSSILGIGLVPALVLAKSIAAHLTSGTASAISASSFTLTRGSKTYTVNVASAATVIDNNWRDIALIDIKTGDRVNVFGKINGTTIDAIYVRDRSLPSGFDVKEMTGAASSTTATSFTLKRGTKTSTINIGSHTMLFDKNWTAINSGDIKDGHKVTVYGRTQDNGATVNAIYVVDKSLPAS